MKLKQYLQINNIIVKEFAEELNVSHIHLSGVVTGKRKPSIHLAREIARKCNYDVTVAELRDPSLSEDLNVLCKKRIA